MASELYSSHGRNSAVRTHATPTQPSFDNSSFLRTSTGAMSVTASSQTVPGATDRGAQVYSSSGGLQQAGLERQPGLLPKAGRISTSTAVGSMPAQPQPLFGGGVRKQTPRQLGRCVHGNVLL